VALVLYGVASLLFIAAFTEAPAWLMTCARWVLFVGFLAHGTDISLRAFEQVHPGTSVREALGFLSWLMVGGYLVADLRYKLGMLGAFVAPAGLMILAAARLSPTGDATEGMTVLGRIHISLATLGVAIFAVATGVGAVYLLADRALRKKRFEGLLFRRGIPLETLDRLGHRLILVGFPIFTMALMLGVIWVAQRHSGFDRIEYPIALFTWGAFAWLIVGRTSRGWRGRKAAMLTIAGFTAALIVFAIYFIRRAVG
jgi:ABC-type uncharacterized transport system permease subunit